MATTPQYTTIPKIGICRLSSTTLNSNVDGSGTLLDLFTAGSVGSRVDEVLIKALGNTLSEVIRLYIDDGTDANLLTEIAIIDTTSLVMFETGIKLELVLPPDYKLKASSPTLQSPINVIAVGGDF